MALADDPNQIENYVAPGNGTAARIFGWGTIALMGVFLINNILTFWFKWPGVAPFFGWQSSGEVGFLAAIQLGLYVLAIVLTIAYVKRTEGRMLRVDGEMVSDFNRFLVRAAFWTVVLVGIVDATLSFLRVEGLLATYFGPEMEASLKKSAFRGFYIHFPLILLGIVLAMVTRTIGVIWLALLVVVAELLIVFSRFIFSYEQAFMGDLVRFWYAALFLFASAYTLLEDGHVRVDVVYASLSRRGRAVVNSWGAIFLGMTLCWTVLILGMWSARSIINGPILIYETAQTVLGMSVKYFMAGFLGVFAVTMMLQFIAAYFDARADKRGEPGGREIHGEIIH